MKMMAEIMCMVNY